MNTTTGFKSIGYAQPKVLVSINSTATTSGTYGPVVTTYSVGQSVSNLVINAKSALAPTVNVNVDNQIGSGFSYFSQWDHFSNSTIAGWDTYGKCYVLRYLYYYTNYLLYLNGTTFSSNYQLMTGAICTCDTSGAITAATISLSTGYLPSKWGITIPGWSAVSQQSGALLYLKQNINTIANSLSITNMTFPVVGPNMVNAVGTWNLSLPVQLDYTVLITIKTKSLSVNLPFTFTGTCAVYYNNLKTPVGCNFAYSPTSIDYTLTIL